MFSVACFSWSLQADDEVSFAAFFCFVLVFLARVLSKGIFKVGKLMFGLSNDLWIGNEYWYEICVS